MTDARRCRVFRLPTASPDDVSGVLRLLASGEVRAGEIRAVIGKTEGNGLVNDFTRAFAVSALQHALAGPLGCTPAEVAQRVAIVMSGGTEGGLSPHLLVFAAGPTDAPMRRSLAIGTAFTRPSGRRRSGACHRSRPPRRALPRRWRQRASPILPTCTTCR